MSTKEITETKTGTGNFYSESQDQDGVAPGTYADDLTRAECEAGLEAGDCRWV